MRLSSPHFLIAVLSPQAGGTGGRYPLPPRRRRRSCPGFPGKTNFRIRKPSAFPGLTAGSISFSGRQEAARPRSRWPPAGFADRRRPVHDFPAILRAGRSSTERSEERRVGKEWRVRWPAEQEKKQGCARRGYDGLEQTLVVSALGASGLKAACK